MTPDRAELRRLMRRHGLTSTAVAQLVGRHPVTVCQWTSGGRPVPTYALVILRQYRPRSATHARAR